MSCTLHKPLDPRVRRTRKLLQDALSALIQEKSFSTISVQDITARATVNRATFYAHYQSKEELAASLLKAEFHTALVSQFTEKPALTREKLVEVSVVVFEFLGNLNTACPKNAAELQDSVGTTIQEALYEMMEAWLTGSNDYRRLFPGCTKETVATVVSWSIYGGAHQWGRSTRRAPVKPVCEEIVSILLR